MTFFNYDKNEQNSSMFREYKIANVFYNERVTRFALSLILYYVQQFRLLIDYVRVRTRKIKRKKKTIKKLTKSPVKIKWKHCVDCGTKWCRKWCCLARHNFRVWGTNCGRTLRLAMTFCREYFFRKLWITKKRMVWGSVDPKIRKCRYKYSHAAFFSFHRNYLTIFQWNKKWTRKKKTCEFRNRFKFFDAFIFGEENNSEKFRQANLQVIATRLFVDREKYKIKGKAQRNVIR